MERTTRIIQWFPPPIMLKESNERRVSLPATMPSTLTYLPKITRQPLRKVEQQMIQTPEKRCFPC